MSLTLVGVLFFCALPKSPAFRYNEPMIDRAIREKLISSAERFLSKEIDSMDFANETASVETEDRGVTIAGGTRFFMIYFAKGKYYVEEPGRAWELVRRWMAFLRSDYQLDTENEFHVSAWNYRKRWRWAVSVLAMGPLVFWGQWGLYSVACLAVWLVWSGMWIYKKRCDRKIRESNLDRWRAKLAFEPFYSEEDWNAHRHLIDDCSIPPTPPPIEDDWKINHPPISNGILWGLVFSPLVPLWVPFHCSGNDDIQHEYTVYQRTGSDPTLL
jgi:hypothetical protein